MDETMLTVSSKRKPKVIVPREWHEAPKMTPDEKNMHITLVCAISATGDPDIPRVKTTAILPKLENFPLSLSNLIEFFDWTATDSGWITEDIFGEWVNKVFIPHVNMRRHLLSCEQDRALLWLDGHSSRSSLSALEALRNARIDAITIPGHTSHVLQPLDAGVFRAFKNKIPKFYHDPCERSIPNVRAALLTAATRALYEAMFPGVVMTAFEKAGCVPFNPDLILSDPSKIVMTEGGIPDTPAPRKRGFSMSNTLITSDEALAYVREAKTKAATKLAKRADALLKTLQDEHAVRQAEAST